MDAVRSHLLDTLDHRSVWRSVILAAAFACAATFAFEASKQAVFGEHLTLWESHLITIGFVTSLGAGVAVIIAHRSDVLHRSLARTIAKQHEAEAALRQAGAELEQRVRERTTELSARNEALLEQVAERERAEAALSRTELRLAEAERIARLGKWVWTSDGSMLRSPEVTRMLRLAPGVPLTLESLFTELVHPDDRQRTSQALGRVMGGAHDLTIEYRLVLPEVGIRTVLVRAESERDASGVVVRLVGTLQDITDERQAEVERQSLASAVEQATDAVMMVSRDGTITFINPAFERTTGFTAGEAVGQPLEAVLGRGLDVDAPEELLRTVRAGQVWKGELQNRRRDGADFTWELSVTPVRDAAGAIAHFIAIGEDITARRLLEAQFRQAQKMEAVGRLAGGLAHDFNNILTVIIGQTEMLLLTTPKEQPVYRALGLVRDAATKAAGLTSQLLTFSRQRVVSSSEVNCDTLVSGLEPMLRRLIGEDIDLVILPSGDGLQVQGDVGQLEHVLVNLVVNARDAMPAGGRLTIQVGTARIRAPHQTRHGVLEPGDYALISVTDSGHGISREMQERIFEPFFTTKPVGKGSGLGLSTVYGIVSQHDGQIEVYSEVNVGTTFKLYLPVVGATGTQTPTLQPPGPDTTLQPGVGTVLVAEDDAQVRGLVCQVLQRAGYTVIEAQSGPEALLFSERFTGRIDLLVSDLVMPEMSGLALVEQLRTRRPGIPTLLMSGYPDHAVVETAAPEDSVFMRKPFAPTQLLTMVHAMLTDGATPA